MDLQENSLERDFRVSRGPVARETARAYNDREALRRRSWYIYSLTAGGFGLIGLVIFRGVEPGLAKTIVDGSFSLIEVVAISYLGANVIDRTRLVDRVTRFSDPPQGPLGGPLPPLPPSEMTVRNVYGGPPPGLGSPYS